MKELIKTLVAAGVVGSTAVLAAPTFAWSNRGAEIPFSCSVMRFLTMARDRSMKFRSRTSRSHLDDQALIRARVRATQPMC